MVDVLWLECAKWLTISEVAKLGNCSKRFHHITQSESLWKLLLFRDVRVNNASLAYEVCCIERDSFRDTYRRVSDTTTSVQQLVTKCEQLLSPRSVISSNAVQVISLLVRLIENGSVVFLEPLLILLVDVKSQKSSKYAELFMKCITVYNFHNSFHFFRIGILQEQFFKDPDAATTCYEIGMEAKNVSGFLCCIELLKTQSVEDWTKKALAYFPTKKHEILFALANRDPHNIGLLMAALEAYDSKTPDNLSLPHDVTRSEILEKCGECHQGNSNYEESLKFYRLALLHNFDQTRRAVVYGAILEILVKNLKRLDEASQFILERRIASGQVAECLVKHYWVITEEYVTLRQVNKINLELFRHLASVSTSEWMPRLHALKCLVHYIYFNFGLGVESGLLAMKNLKENMRVARYLGRCYMKLGNYDSALDTFNKYLEIDRNAPILLELALFYLVRKSKYYNHDLARQSFDEANTLCPLIRAWDFEETKDLVARKLEACTCKRFKKV
jgi:tetratricopeptide (TPR) repeat protein